MIFLILPQKNKIEKKKNNVFLIQKILNLMQIQIVRINL
jgi:hypothetical protein